MIWGCSYGCSARHEKIEVDPDITGTGVGLDVSYIFDPAKKSQVIVGYVAVTGIAVNLVPP
jgi:hypothetical protein